MLEPFGRKGVFVLCTSKTLRHSDMGHVPARLHVSQSLLYFLVEACFGCKPCNSWTLTQRSCRANYDHLTVSRTCAVIVFALSFKKSIDLALLNGGVIIIVDVRA